LRGGTRVALAPAMPTNALVAPCGEDGDLSPIAVDADPNGLAYDRHTAALYIADCRGGAILRIDGDRPRPVAAIDLGQPAGANRLGGLALTQYGTMYVSRLGHGHGAVFRVEPDGSAEPLAKLCQRDWRVGLTYDPFDHVLFATRYAKTPHTGPHSGAIIEIDLVDGYPTTIADGFVKPLGVAKVGASLVVTDARLRAVVRLDLSGGRAVHRSTLADNLDRPDSVCACSPDSVLVTTYDELTGRGTLHRLWLAGGSRAIASGPWEPRGVATDGNRAFVAQRRGGRVLVFRLD
jgi:hypothetical protein